jgi:hypothetical protein
MPLRFFIPSLQRVTSALPNSVYDHTLFDPLLLTARSCARKYSHDVPEILAQDEEHAELEAEEAMIWYAFSNEKEPEGGHGSQDAVDEDEWRKRWLDRMEKREYDLHCNTILNQTNPLLGLKYRFFFI